MHKAVCGNDGTYNFEEECPNCGHSIPIEIDDSDFSHYEIECPECHETMLLCTLCRWDQELEDGFDGAYKCDWHEPNMCYRKG